MRHIALLLPACLALAACDRGQPVQPASPISTSMASASTTLGALTLKTSTVAIADLNPATAARYGIDRAQDGVLLLVTVRDAAGNAAEPGDLQLTASAAVLPDPPTSLDLRVIRTDGMTDYLGVVHAKAPASVRFQLTAVHGGARAQVAATADLQAR